MNPLISKEQIDQKIKTLAKELESLYAGKEVTLVIVLKGALFFAVDLLRALNLKTRVETLSASSYGDGRTSGELVLCGIDKMDLEARDVLIVDDIFDTGKTMCAIQKELLKKKPASLRTCTLLAKSSSPSELLPDFVLFTIGDAFVYGYGLDLEQNCREKLDVFLV